MATIISVPVASDPPVFRLRSYLGNALELTSILIWWPARNTCDVLDDLQAEQGLTYLFIAHDLSVVRHIADRVAVMYLGKVIELADGDLLYASPRHPYTSALLSAVPVPDPRPAARAGQRRIRLQGEAPGPLSQPSGCRFRARCWKARDICQSVEPPLAGPDARHLVAGHFPEEARQPAARSVNTHI